MQIQSLSQRKREAVRRELTVIAVDLFARDGYEQTTVDAIAEAAGMSKRTFFRYYASKDDVVIGKWQTMGDDIVTRFRGRAADEPLIDALRAALDVVVEHYADTARQSASSAFDRIIAETPQLSARFLYEVSTIEQRLAAEAAETRPEIPPLRLRALVGAVGACLLAAMADVLPEHPEGLGRALDHVLAETVVR
ncbi:TetR family transcriptional regulator [Microbacterium sp.]|uniref:TetR family transcriptional regulator n=1 Tax=Microbacterium sp. TaxID=51671 RepID=UPI00334277A4